MKSKISLYLSYFCVIFLVCFVNAQEVVEKGRVMAKAAAAVEAEYLDHGWAKLDVVRNKTPYDMLFYSDPRGLVTMLPEGTVVRIKSLKTGFGNFYRVKKDDKGVWRLYADTRDSKDPATPFIISRVGKSIVLKSEAAGGLLLESNPKTFEVFLTSNKVSDNSLWDLVEDPKAGDTLETCYLKNKGTGGLLTASYDIAAGAEEAEMANLKSKIEKLEKDIPYLTITYARTEGIGNSFTADLSRDIRGKLQEYVRKWVLDSQGNRINVYGVGGYLEVGGNWIPEFSGISSRRWSWASVHHKRNRKVRIKYREGDDPTEKILVLEGYEVGGDKPDRTLIIKADINKHPATSLRRQLRKLEMKIAGAKGLRTSDIARTGFAGDLFKMNQWSKVAVQMVTGIGEEDDRGAPKESIPGGSSRDLFLWAHRRPEFRGFGSEEIPGFGPEMVVTVNPLFSKGFAWLDQSLPNPGQGTIVFRALADEGDVQACFSDSVAPYTVYRVVFGGEGNNKTILYKNDIKVQEITKDQNSNARIMPGIIEQCWVSINNGFIMIGKGDPGSNFLMAWQDPEPAPGIERVGFSTFKSTVKYTDVERLADPIVLISPQIAYVTDEGSIRVGSKGSPAWHKLPLSPADAGTVVFKAKGKEDATLVLADDKNKGYEISFGSDGNTTAKIVRLDGGQELYRIDAGKLPLARLEPDKINRFWVSFYKGLIILGSGDVGKNPFCIYVDSNAPKGLSKIGFSGKASMQDLEIWPEIEFGFEEEISEYVKPREFSSFKGSLSIIAPYNYRIVQRGPQVIFRDRLTGMQWNMAGTPEPEAEYHFSVDVEENGEPRTILLFQDPSAERIKIERNVLLTESQAEASFRVGQIMAYGTGLEIISSMLALTGASIASAAGAAWSAAAADQRSKLNELQELANRYIYTERVEQAARGKGEIREEAQRNRQLAEAKLEAILQLQLSDTTQLDYATKQWDDVLRLVTDFYVVDDIALKRRVADCLKEVYDAVRNLDLTTSSLPIYNRMINILIKAYNNPYLTKIGDRTDELRKRDWYVWINTLAKTLLDSSKLMQIGIDVNFKGEYLWFPVSLHQPGKGSITFEARGYNNIFIGLSENPFQVRNRPTRMYEIVIGKWDNRETAIHRKSLGDPVVEFDHKSLPDLSPNPMTFKKYWLNIDDGIISCGVGELGQNKLWEWKDPYPFAPVKWVGISNWISEVTFRNVKIGYPIFAREPLLKEVPEEVIEPKEEKIEVKIEELKIKEKPPKKPKPVKPKKKKIKKRKKKGKAKTR